MFRRWSVGAAVVVGMLSLLLPGTGANAAEIKVLSAVAMKPALDDLAREFERGTGHTVTMAYAMAGIVRDRIREGEAVDVAILPRSAFDPLMAQGKIAPGTATVDALKRALLAAKSIVYPDPAELQNTTDFVFWVGVGASAKEAAAASAFIKYLLAPGVARAIKAKGMEPGAE